MLCVEIGGSNQTTAAGDADVDPHAVSRLKLDKLVGSRRQPQSGADSV